MAWGAPSGPLTDGERYEFDVRGYLVRRGALSANEVRMLRLAVVELALERPGETLQSQRFSGHLRRDQSFRDLLDHPAVLEPLVELCGPTLRLDHAYGITMAPGSAGLGLHGGATPHDPSQTYAVRGGRMYNGLVAAQWALVDHRRGDGGFGCIPGSHKAEFVLPPQTDPALVAEVTMAAGDVVFFTEALTHCTIPWRGPIDRLTLLYKYAPGHMAWSADDNDAAQLAPLLTDRQRRLLQRPAVHGHQPVR
jgi:Phytanoyl-CoA dioxygenase (PhyH)